jgi:hypothetical protein
MPATNIIPIDEAIKARFSSSTTEELQQYLSDAGIEFVSTEPQDSLRRKCLAMVGLSSSDPVQTPDKKVAGKKSTKEDIVPPYRLDPNGLWAGRKWRVRVPRPDGNTQAKAAVYSWNGKREMWVPYEEVVSIPEPIYQIMLDLKRTMHRTEEIPGSKGEMTTVFEFADFSLQIIGIDPLTADRAGSITEWYQWKKPSWFRKRNTRELQQIAGMLDIDVRKRDVNRTSKADDELIADILLFLFADANAEDAET